MIYLLFMFLCVWVDQHGGVTRQTVINKWFLRLVFSVSLFTQNKQIYWKSTVWNYCYLSAETKNKQIISQSSWWNVTFSIERAAQSVLKLNKTTILFCSMVVLRLSVLQQLWLRMRRQWRYEHLNYKPPKMKHMQIRTFQNFLQTHYPELLI